MWTTALLWALVVAGVIAEVVMFENRARRYGLGIEELLKTRSEPFNFVFGIIGTALFWIIIQHGEPGILNVLAWIGLVLAGLGLLYSFFRLGKPTPEDYIANKQSIADAADDEEKPSGNDSLGAAEQAERTILADVITRANGIRVKVLIVYSILLAIGILIFVFREQLTFLDIADGMPLQLFIPLLILPLWLYSAMRCLGVTLNRYHFAQYFGESNITNLTEIIDSIDSAALIYESPDSANFDKVIITQNHTISIGRKIFIIPNSQIDSWETRERRVVKKLRHFNRNDRDSVLQRACIIRPGHHDMVVLTIHGGRKPLQMALDKDVATNTLSVIENKFKKPEGLVEYQNLARACTKANLAVSTLKVVAEAMWFLMVFTIVGAVWLGFHGFLSGDAAPIEHPRDTEQHYTLTEQQRQRSEETKRIFASELAATLSSQGFEINQEAILNRLAHIDILFVPADEIGESYAVFYPDFSRITFAEGRAGQPMGHDESKITRVLVRALTTETTGASHAWHEAMIASMAMRIDGQMGRGVANWHPDERTLAHIMDNVQVVLHGPAELVRAQFFDYSDLFRQRFEEHQTEISFADFNALLQRAYDEFPRQNRVAEILDLLIRSGMVSR